MLLYENWKNLNYPTKIKPSLDRIKDNIGYSFDNILVSTWAENRSKSHSDRFFGKLITTQNMAVSQLSLSGEVLNRFVSQSEASRKTGVLGCNIGRCCNGDRKTAGGFRWLNANKKEIK